MTARPVKDAFTHVKEDLLEQRILDLCALLHLRTMLINRAVVRGRYVTPYKGTGKGWPDLTVVGPGGMLFRELKQDGKYPTPEQRLWLAALAAAGGDAGVWKTADWDSGRIERELQAIREAP